MGEAFSEGKRGPNGRLLEAARGRRGGRLRDGPRAIGQPVASERPSRRPPRPRRYPLGPSPAQAKSLAGASHAQTFLALQPPPGTGPPREALPRFGKPLPHPRNRLLGRPRRRDYEPDARGQGGPRLQGDNPPDLR